MAVWARHSGATRSGEPGIHNHDRSDVARPTVIYRIEVMDSGLTPLKSAIADLSNFDSRSRVNSRSVACPGMTSSVLVAFLERRLLARRAACSRRVSFDRA